MGSMTRRLTRYFPLQFLIGLVLGSVLTLAVMNISRGVSPDPDAPASGRQLAERKIVDTSGYSVQLTSLKPWSPAGSLDEVEAAFRGLAPRVIQAIDRQIAARKPPDGLKVEVLQMKAGLWNSEGQPAKAYEVLREARALADRHGDVAREHLATLLYFQGVTALRLGENENCIECRGESSCILPIAPTAVHLNPRGSRMAIGHFTDYLRHFPDDLEVRWLLNLAHMTLGEYPDKVDPRYLVSLDGWRKSEFDVGRFRDVGHLAGVNHFGQAGGAIMEDLDNDGRLDLVTTGTSALEPMVLYRNSGDGTFEDRTEAAGLASQRGGLVCYQTDYNNDGWMDILIVRGAWLRNPIRPSLLRNDGDGKFTDVTVEAGLGEPVNSNSASWADYDNDGWLDLFIACEAQPNRLYHNKGDGTFEEVAIRAQVHGFGRTLYKGSTWIDYDNDGYPDLFLNCLNGSGELQRNNHDGTFTEVTTAMGIDGPVAGFSCWSWDYDNDGWLDILATCYERSLGDTVKGLLGEPHRRQIGRLYRNLGGTGFEDVSRQVGLDGVYATMGSNFADFDNDGFLDVYFGTGEPSLATLVPNRMFRSVAAKRFSEITVSAGVGHLQKGHAVACGDWDRDGDVDIYIDMGGAVDGDQYHNILFQNPGQGNHSLTVKLVGVKSNRAAIGARIKVVTDGEHPQTLHRHVTSGSSFGANPLEQTIGLGTAQKVAQLEVYWPTTGTTQVFRDLAADQSIEITEFAERYRSLERKPIPLPEE